MTKSSLTTMFNRLPIYSRPKEPAIGHPVLTESSNARLSPDRGIRIVGLDGRPYRSGAFDTAKGLPQIPYNTGEDYLRPFPLSGPPASSKPAPALAPTAVPSSPRRRSPSPAPQPTLPAHARPPTPPWGASSSSSSATVARKPVVVPTIAPRTPSPAPLGVSTLIVGGTHLDDEHHHHHQQRKAKKSSHRRRDSAADLLYGGGNGGNGGSGGATQQKSTGMGMGMGGMVGGLAGLVKGGGKAGRNARRRGSVQVPPPAEDVWPPPRLQHSPPPLLQHPALRDRGEEREWERERERERREREELHLHGLPFDNPAAETVVLRPGAHSIDDWLDQRQGLHVRSATITSQRTTASSRHRPSNDPAASPSSGSSPSRTVGPKAAETLKLLALRQSTFAPLPVPSQLTASEPPLPPVPSIPSQFQTPTPTTTTAASSPAALASSVPLPLPPPPAPVDPASMDHLSQLEHASDTHEARARALRAAIAELDTVLPPNPGTHNVEERATMRARVVELRQALADEDKALHEAGLRLARARRRRDKREGTEGPTHLWVSRVTA